MAQFLSALIYFFLCLMSVFLICLVLIQRGKGGGLAGAFGGPGGSSAFGSKAGDVFTRVTMVSAGIWIVLNMILVVLANQREVTWGDTDAVGSASKSAFTPADGKDAPPSATGTPSPGNPEAKSSTAPAPATTGPALAPSSATGKGTGTAAPAPSTDGMPNNVFAPEAAPLPPQPAGSTPAPGGTGPKP